MQTHVQNTEYRDLPVAALIESPSNPRKRFDEGSLSELAAYVAEHISCVLCPWSFCGRGRQTARGDMDVSFSERHITRTTET
jgi:hypothetical protein